ncbi:MAG: hypothetical protein EOP85_03150 [Verrucomicrobiaceae bacterium]|nr:MAG: hypothetical protein EOP85_03150 [Verrucomicrobiaceae bacterium]
MKRGTITLKHLAINLAVAIAYVVLTNIWHSRSGDSAGAKDLRQGEPTEALAESSATGERDDARLEAMTAASGDDEEPDLDAMWLAAMDQNSSERERVTDLVGVAGTMASRGQAFEALEKVLASVGPGESRCRLVLAIFQMASDVRTLEKCYRLLEFEDEKEIACKGLSDRLSVESSPDKTDFSRFRYLGDRLDQLISSNVTTYILRHSTSGEAEASEVFARSMVAGMSPEAERAVISDTVAVVPFSCWDHLVKKGADSTDADLSRVVTEMFRLDPEEAIERISRESATSDSFNAAFQAWMKADASKPIAWLGENPAKLTARQKDRAYQGIATYAAQQGDRETAAKWAGMISDPAIQAEVEITPSNENRIAASTPVPATYSPPWRPTLGFRHLHAKESGEIWRNHRSGYRLA